MGKEVIFGLKKQSGGPRATICAQGGLFGRKARWAAVAFPACMSVVPASWTDDWGGVGRTGAAAKFAELSSENQCTPLLYELFRAVLQGSLKSEHLIELLTEMDGFAAQDKPVIVLAATNQPEVLDAALLRPGRFDRQVLVDRPDLSGRKTILEIYANKVKLAAGVDLDSVAQATSGFAGAGSGAGSTPKRVSVPREASTCV